MGTGSAREGLLGLYVISFLTSSCDRGSKEETNRPVYDGLSPELKISSTARICFCIVMMSDRIMLVFSMKYRLIDLYFTLNNTKILLHHLCTGRNQTRVCELELLLQTQITYFAIIFFMKRRYIVGINVTP